MLATQYVTGFLFFNPKIFLVAFTNWSLMITTASILSSYWAANDMKHFGYNSLISKDAIHSAARKQATHNLLFSFSVICNLVVVAVYWPFLHQDLVVKFSDYPGRIFHLHTVHIIPALCCLVNTWITHCHMNRSIWKVVAGLGILYSVMQYVIIKTLGVVLYPSLVNF